MATDIRKLQLKKPTNDRACNASSEHLRPEITATERSDGQAVAVTSARPPPVIEKMIVSNEVSTTTPPKSVTKIPLLASPPSPPRRRPHRASQSKSLESSQPVKSQQASPLTVSKRPSPRSPPQPSRVERLPGRAALSSEAVSTAGGKSGKASRTGGRRFIQQDLSQNQEGGQVGIGESAAKEEVRGGDSEGEEPDTIE